jgi:hypothetical protein
MKADHVEAADQANVLLAFHVGLPEASAPASPYRAMFRIFEFLKVEA